MGKILTDALSLAAFATAVCVPLLWRIIRIQKATIQALSIHVQMLTAYLETLTSRIKSKKGSEADQKAPSLKSFNSQSAKFQPLNKADLPPPGHKKAS